MAARLPTGLRWAEQVWLHCTEGQGALSTAGQSRSLWMLQVSVERRDAPVGSATQSPAWPAADSRMDPGEGPR